MLWLASGASSAPLKGERWNSRRVIQGVLPNHQLYFEISEHFRTSAGRRAGLRGGRAAPTRLRAAHGGGALPRRDLRDRQRGAKLACFERRTDEWKWSAPQTFRRFFFSLGSYLAFVSLLCLLLLSSLLKMCGVY